MAKFTHHIRRPRGAPTPGGTEGDRADGHGSGFCLFPPSPSSHPAPFPPPRCRLPTSQDPQEGSYLNGRGSGPEGGGVLLSTLTQLVRLIKRVCGLWGQSSIPPRDRKTKEILLLQRFAAQCCKIKAVNVAIRMRRREESFSQCNRSSKRIHATAVWHTFTCRCAKY